MKRLFFLLQFVFFVSAVAWSQEAPEGLFIDSKAPDFKSKDQDGNEIRLKDVLKKGKVILVFYRGQWCPYCNRFLSALQDSLQLIKDKGASLIAVSPEKPESIDSTVEKTKVTFPVLYDEELKIMKAYDVEYEVPENTLTRYRNAGLDIEKNNGPNGKYLPITAVYIIGDEQTVIYRFFEKDYKKRPAVKTLLTYL
ncbi:MAG TPA: peroxiredoxin-like family protein [Chitinophagaceae bacterium]|nr:peroxiredoxin-like family protein [Chitinophagaceae bacterium]